MALIFDEIITKGVRAGQIPARTQDAREWYRDTAAKFTRLNERQIMQSEPERLVMQPMLGSMYMYYYDPKYKEELPFYDRFPLVFPFRKVKGGFFGLNLHYLPLQFRAKLMDALYGYANNTRYDESTKIKMNYELLAKTAKLRYFAPCVKHYLTNHMRSKFMYIYPSEWDIALFLPTERFQKANKTEVWNNSKKIIGVSR
jgi:hypothetical protein